MHYSWFHHKVSIILQYASFKLSCRSYFSSRIIFYYYSHDHVFLFYDLSISGMHTIIHVYCHCSLTEDASP